MLLGRTVGVPVAVSVAVSVAVGLAVFVIVLVAGDGTCCFVGNCDGAGWADDVGDGNDEEMVA
jgi:hypothetical protein